MNLSIDKQKLFEATCLANSDYELFRRAFDHDGPPTTNPLLTDNRLFKSFMSDYGISRTIAKYKDDDFRLTLRDDPAFSSALSDTTGRLLEKYHDQTLKPNFGTHDGQYGLLSATSKFATALSPMVFMPWDQYARKGLNVFIGRRPYTLFTSYEEFLRLCRTFLESELALSIRRKSSRDPIFQRRVLDMYLMCLGDYNRSSTRTCS